MERMSTRVRLTLALIVSAAGLLGSFSVYGHGLAGSPAHTHYLAGDTPPTGPRTMAVIS
jgi:hypothetical protein